MRREKVWYVNFVKKDDCRFSLVIFDKYFKHFTYTDEQLKGRNVLAYGFLKKNNFNEELKSTEMLIKSNKCIEFLKVQI